MASCVFNEGQTVDTHRDRYCSFLRADGLTVAEKLNTFVGVSYDSVYHIVMTLNHRFELLL